MVPPDRRRVRLGVRLRELRERTGLSGNRFADTVGWAESEVSRVETGSQLPSEADIKIWVTATGQGRLVESELLGLRAAARFEYSTVKDMLRRGGMAASRFMSGRWKPKRPASSSTSRR